MISVLIYSDGNGSDKNRTKKGVLFLLFWLFLFFPIEYLNAKSVPGEAGISEMVDPPRFSLGYIIKQLVLGDVSEEDLLTAMEIWSKELAKEVGFRSETHVFNDLDSMVKNFNQGKIDMGGASGLEYLKIKENIESEPGIGFVRDGKKSVKYMLLVSSDSDITDIKELKGKKVALVKRNDLSILFLNTILLRNKMEEADTFFAKTLKKDHFSQVILSIFFKEVDAGIATDIALDIMSELNPQVGKRIKAIEISPDLVERLGFFHKDFKYKEKVKHQCSKIHESARGRQFLILFKIDTLAPLLPSDLKSTENLYNEYRILKNKKKE